MAVYSDPLQLWVCQSGATENTSAESDCYVQSPHEDATPIAILILILMGKDQKS